MRPRMGFALVRTSHHAGVSTRSSANVKLAVVGVPPIAGLAAPAHLLNFFNYSERSSPKTARHAAASGFAVLTVRLVRIRDHTG